MQAWLPTESGSVALAPVCCLVPVSFPDQGWATFPKPHGPVPSSQVHSLHLRGSQMAFWRCRNIVRCRKHFKCYSNMHYSLTIRMALPWLASTNDFAVTGTWERQPHCPLQKTALMWASGLWVCVCVRIGRRAHFQSQADTVKTHCCMW